MHLLKNRWDTKYLILWFMIAVYPLVVLPYKFCVSFPTINQYFLSCFYTPRYIIMAILAIMALIILARERAQLKHPALIPLGLFLFFALISTLLAANPITAWIGSPYRYTGFTTYLFCTVLFLMAYSNSHHAEKLLKYTIYTAVLVSFVALLQHLGYNPVPHEPYREGSHSYSTMGNPNFLGNYLVFVLPSALLFFLNKRKTFWLFCSVFISAGLLVCQSRGAWITFLITFIIIFFYFFRIPEKRKLLVLLILVCVVASSPFLFAKDGEILKSAGSIPQELTYVVQFKENAAAGRMLIWQENIKLLPEHWAFGVGPDHLGYRDYKRYINNAPIDKAHNIFLELAVTMGVFALLSYLVFLASFLRPVKNEPGFIFFIMIITYLIQGLFNIEVIMVMPLFWIVLGFALGLQQKPYES